MSAGLDSFNSQLARSGRESLFSLTQHEIPNDCLFNDHIISSSKQGSGLLEPISSHWHVKILVYILEYNLRSVP